jgi:superfamily II DNA or RNA helicase
VTLDEIVRTLKEKRKLDAQFDGAPWRVLAFQEQERLLRQGALPHTAAELLAAPLSDAAKLRVLEQVLMHVIGAEVGKLDLKKLEAWATEHNVSRELGMRVAVISDERIGWHDTFTVRDAWPSLPPARRAPIGVGLAARAWAAQRSAALAADLDRRRAADPGDAATPLLDHLHDLRAALIAQGARDRGADTPRAWLNPRDNFVALGETWVMPFEGPFDASTLPPSPLGADTLLGNIGDFLRAAYDPTRPVRSELARMLSEPAWQRDLAWLDTVLTPSEAAPTLLGWRIKPDTYEIEAVRVTVGKRGAHSTKRVPIEPSLLPSLTEPSDAFVYAACLGQRSLPPATFALVLSRLCGHPRVYASGGRAQPVRVQHHVVEASLAPSKGGLELVARAGGAPIPKHHLPTDAAAQWVVRSEIEGAITLYEWPPGVRQVWWSWLRRKPKFGPDAVDALRSRFEQLGRYGVTAAKELRGDEVHADPRPLLRLTWTEAELHLAALVRPIPEALAFPPGDGPEALFSTRDGRVVTVTRARAAEPDQVRAALVPLGLPDSDGFSWSLRVPDDALDVLTRLRDVRAQYQVEWTGTPVDLQDPLGFQQVTIRASARDATYWLGGGIEGGADLAALTEAALAGHAYVQVGAHAFARLDRQLRAALEALGSAATPSRGGIAVTPLHSGLVRDFADAGAIVDAPPALFAHEDNVRAAAEYVAPVPELVTATLRPYQVTGFQWLARLARWSPGAVLADDMGLGKTLQAIALLAHRAAEGPALVVAPTSVVFNWHRELERFAPGLVRVDYYGGARTLPELVPGQVVLTSWGVLVRDASALAAVPWATAVLDEAQAIKNPTTHRARAAFALDAAFRLALTGTPVENHPEDLWSILRFAAPGLLGSRDGFDRRFAAPIVAGVKSRGVALARIVAPFVLRRRKREVEPDLPSRTEQIVYVTLSPAERALYEHGRMSALARVEAASQDRRFTVLAELTRLRQLACHPRLLDDGSPVPSSKMAALLEIVTGLKENGHQTLVFSQFTRHLDLAHAALRAAAVTTLDLRGSTSADQRAVVVDQFQRGEADALLLSLKAGGTGLNLTAATYVVHLDPWWNPAAEDQASDRAHRLGQTRPVTIYRLVGRGTIEEQISSLHAEKRDMADALLSGAGPVDVDALVALLREPVAGAPADDDVDLEAYTPPPPPPRPAPAAPAAPAAPVASGRGAGLPELRAVASALQASLDARELAESTRNVYKNAAKRIERDLAAACAESPDRLKVVLTRYLNGPWKPTSTGLQMGRKLLELCADP